MKYLAALVLGLLSGAALGVLMLFINPLASDAVLSPLSVSDSEIMVLNYSASASDAIAYTNDGESMARPQPDKILQLWEKPIRRTGVLVTTLSDSRNRVTGLGIKFRSDSEATRLVNGQVLADSAWYLYLPERGSLFIEQRENYWQFFKEVVVPAWLSSADSWKGNWFGNTTTGPNPIGTARVTGGSGEFAGLDAEAVEAISARAFSIDRGAVAVDGTLTIELPRPAESPLARDSAEVGERGTGIGD